jgi:hypothetical protein
MTNKKDTGEIILLDSEQTAKAFTANRLSPRPRQEERQEEMSACVIREFYNEVLGIPYTIGESKDNMDDDIVKPNITGKLVGVHTRERLISVAAKSVNHAMAVNFPRISYKIIDVSEHEVKVIVANINRDRVLYKIRRCIPAGIFVDIVGVPEISLTEVSLNDYEVSVLRAFHEAKLYVKCAGGAGCTNFVKVEAPSPPEEQLCDECMKIMGEIMKGGL